MENFRILVAEGQEDGEERERISRLDWKTKHQKQEKEIKKGMGGTEEYFSKRVMSCS